MQVLSKNEKKLAKELEEDKGIGWHDYLKRFELTKPLEIWPTSLDKERFSPEIIKREDDFIIKVSSKFKLQKLIEIPEIIAGFKSKIRKEEIDKLDYLNRTSLNLKRLYRKNVIDIMQKICPDDFQAIPVTLISQNKNVEPFEIKDFYMINVLKCVKAIDEEKSEIKWSDSWANIKKFRYKENPWKDGCIPISGPDSPKGPAKYPQHHMDKPCMLAIDALSGAVIWHPAIAKQLPVSPLCWFIQDFEQKP